MFPNDEIVHMPSAQTQARWLTICGEERLFAEVFVVVVFFVDILIYINKTSNTSATITEMWLAVRISMEFVCIYINKTSTTSATMAVTEMWLVV